MKLSPIFVLISIFNYCIVACAVVLPTVFKLPQTELQPLIESSSQPLVLPPTAKPPHTKQVNTITPISPTPTPSPKPTTAPTTSPVAATPGCLVQINGISYDLQTFRSNHGGGDIFQCNTDMTAIFSGQHPTSYLQQLEQYRL